MVKPRLKSVGHGLVAVITWWCKDIDDLCDRLERMDSESDEYARLYAEAQQMRRQGFRLRSRLERLLTRLIRRLLRFNRLPLPGEPPNAVLKDQEGI